MQLACLFNHPFLPDASPLGPYLNLNHLQKVKIKFYYINEDTLNQKRAYFYSFYLWCFLSI